MVNEKRLIDANALMDAIEVTDWYHISPKGYLQKGANSQIHTPLFKTDDIFQALKDAPTVDAVEVAGMRDFAEDVVYQFGYYCHNGGRLHITHGGLSTLEWAFDILGWENPHPVPEFECELDGCHEHATCGTPTDDGYKFVCHKHYREIEGRK